MKLCPSNILEYSKNRPPIRKANGGAGGVRGRTRQGLTFVEARGVEVLDESVVRLLVVGERPFDELAQLFGDAVADLAERRHRRLVVGDHRLLLETAAGEGVEVVARVHRRVHVLQQLGRCSPQRSIRIHY